VKAFISLFVFV